MLKPRLRAQGDMTGSVETPSRPMGSSDSLISRLRVHDAVAWQRFSELLGPVVYGWGRRAGLQDSDAADITQEVFHVVAQQIQDFRKTHPGDSFRGWLWGITRHKIADCFRVKAASPELSTGSAIADKSSELSEIPPDTGDTTRDAALAQRALALIRTDFEVATWQAFLQTAVEGRPAADVAAELKLSVGAVYTAKCRVLARLRQELADLIDE
jgi:RNA polymerase sigma-70 factor, ECF subfamily